MSKRNMIIIVTIVVLAAAIGIAAFMIYQRNIRIAQEKKARNETLIIAFDEFPQTLNPLFEQNDAGRVLLDPIFDGLANRSGESVSDYQDALAYDFVQDQNQRNVYTIELDGERTWHDNPNHKLKAEDIRFTIECIKNERNRSPLRGRINQLIERVEVVEDTIARVIFKEAISAHVVRDLLAFKIIPKSYYGKAMSTDLRADPVAQEFNRKPIGTGKYQFTTWEGNSIVYSLVKAPTAEEEMDADEMAEEGPSGSEIAIQTIEVMLIHDQEKQVRMLLDGNVDLILEAPDKLQTMLNDNGLLKSDYVPLHFYAIAFNLASQTFGDHEIRQAVAKSLNKSELASTIRSDNADAYINKGTFPHNDDVRYRGFDDLMPYSPDKAKSTIQKKGAITTTLIYEDDASKTMERLASKIKLMLGEIGITVEPKGLGRAFETQISNKNYEMALVKHTGFTDGYNIAPLYRSDSPQNITGIQSTRLDTVLRAWENSAFWEQRLPAAKQLHSMLGVLSPYVYLFSLPTSAYYSPRVKNVTIVDPNALLGTVSDWRVTPLAEE